MDARCTRRSKENAAPLEWAMHLEYLAVRRLRERGKRKVYNRNHKLKYRYGITEDQYLRALEECNGCCQICGEPERGGRRLSIDHCHESKDNRGLLCQRCNTAVGMLTDDENLFENAITYIQKWREGLVAEILRRNDNADTRFSTGDRS